jgi:hypothetical protein
LAISSPLIEREFSRYKLIRALRISFWTEDNSIA